MTLTVERLRRILISIGHHGDMPIPMRDHTYEALLALATGRYREIPVWEGDEYTPMRTVDAIALEALVIIALAKLANPTWKHLKRGTTYTEIGRAHLQCADKFGPLCDGDLMVIYQGEDGRLWVREVAEFEDGRFERIEGGA